MNDITKMIEREVLSWVGVTAEPHRFGGIEFRVNEREIGHLHGNYLADLPFSVLIRKELVAEGRAQPHHIYPNSGWVSYYIHSSEEVPAVVELFHKNYKRLSSGSRSELEPEMNHLN